MGCLNRGWSRLCLVLGWAVLSLSLAAQAAVFSTPGQFSVSPNGSASYSIPIQVPPGTAGMAPTLSLNYDSQGGNGILGMGWGLSGLSQITRCPRTIAQDGVKGGINYDANDKLCLDGQRLIAVSGTYGGDGTEYRTELANFAKILSYGVAGNGPAWFKVWTKGGQIIEYGNTTDSRIEAAGIATVRLWGVNKISDTKGNYLTVSYIEDNANGEAYVSRIDYTGNATSTPVLTPYASVQFVYATRSDTTTDTLAGSVIKVQHRMTDIQTYIGTTLVKDYKLTYANTGAYHVNTSNVADGSLLTALTECDGTPTTPTCKNPTNLTWTLGTVNTSTFGAAQSWPSGKVVAIGDVNGDGRADVLYDTATPGGSAGTLYVAFSTGSGFSGAINTGVAGGSYQCTGTSSIGTCTGYAYTPPFAGLGDVNGDGLADLVTASGVRLSTGNAFGSLQSWPTGNVIAVADVNGDGRADVLYDTATPGGSAGALYVAFSTGSGFSGAINTGVAGGSYQCTGTSSIGTCTGYAYTPPFAGLGDVNGDGLADIVSATNVYPATTAVPDRLTVLADGLGVATTVTYAPLSTSGVYTYEPGSAYPLRDLLSAVPLYVVSSVSSSDGLGGNVVTNYTYGGAKVDTAGRGFLGFRWQKSSSPDTGLAVITYNNQTYPYIGLPNQVEKHKLSDNTLLSAASSTYANTPLVTGSATSQFPYVSQTVENHYELDGSLVTSTTTSYQYDSYGNATQVTVNSNDGYIKTTSNTYTNDTTHWFLGRLLRSSVTSTAPDPVIVPVVTPATLSVTVSPSPLVTNAPSPGSYTASASLTVSGGVAPYTYAWSRVTGSRITVSGTQTGSFSVTLGSNENLTESFKVTVTDAAGKVATATLNVTFTTPTISLAASPNPLMVNATAPGTATGSTNLTVSGGVAPYTYTWTRLTGSRITVSGTQTGTFSVSLGWSENLTESFKATVTDAVGNTNSTNVTVTFTSPQAFSFTPTLSANVTNYNLKAAAIAAGWNQTVPLMATVTINSGVIVGSTSTGAYAFDTGATFPAGTTLTLVNNGQILGMGGAGGNGGTKGNQFVAGVSPTAGSPGGPALNAQYAFTVTNNGVIGGGGGGAGGSACGGCVYLTNTTGNGGGGGQGFNGGAGGAAGTSGNQYVPASAGTAGTATSPGSPGGGTLGVAGAVGGTSGAAGGAGGACTSGNGNITWTAAGTRYGALN